MIRWLREAWGVATHIEALSLASPALAGRVRSLLDGTADMPATEIERLVMATARYLIRTRRATPFGAFAGAAGLSFGAETNVGQSQPTLTLGADAEWTAAVLKELEAAPRVRALLPLMANDTVVQEYGKYIALSPSVSSPLLRSSEVAVGRTPVVDLIMHEASTQALTGAELIQVLDEHFPGHESVAWDGVLASLIEHGLLVSKLRPDAFSTDGLAHVLEVLHRYGLHDLAQVAALERIHDALKTAAPERARSLMREVNEEVTQPVTAVTRVPKVQLPEGVAKEAAAGATALWRSSPSTDGAWPRRFHERFVGRYGTRAVVPVSELLHPARGLGRPDFGDQDRDLTEALSARNTTLLGWAHQTAVGGARELVLTESMLDTLGTGREASPRPVPHMEVCAQVLASSQEDVDRERYELWITGVGGSAMTLSGRFVDLLDPEHRDELLKDYGTLPTTVDGATHAQMAFSPLHPRMENVTRTPQLLPEILSVGGGLGADSIDVSDLAVTADQERLFLVSVSRRCVVEPVVAHAASRASWPALVRFLWEVARSGSSGAGLWSWGPLASELPFLPRVRYGRTVLAAARWRVDTTTLPPKTASPGEWERALDTLRERQGWPRWINVGERDRLLYLDLEAAMDRAVLRDHINRAPGTRLMVFEAPDPAGNRWNNGHAHEIVVHLASTTPPASGPAWVAASEWPMFEDRVDLPGQGVLTVHLEGPPERVDTILTHHLPTLVNALDDPPWWVVRYRHPAPHLRVRLHHFDHGTALSVLHTWARDLRERGLISTMSLHTYRPETSRYGTGPAMDAAEQVFTADSAAVQAQLRLLEIDCEIDPRALTAASMVHLARSLAPSADEGDRWLLGLPRSGPSLPRGALRHAIRLTDGVGENLDRLTHAWKRRADACAHYAHTLADTPLLPERVLVSLLHMHHNRALGIDPDGEELITRMARAVALARQSRKGAR